ncbi:MAG TPA: transglycosylase SLT domain-containing protein [Terriglobales bacterium]|nr:transglycosylase SLT domain-containing protein [Terriglobales bacterium]
MQRLRIQLWTELQLHETMGSMKMNMIRDCGLLACGSALALLATACETSDKQVHPKPAVQAQAPTITAPQSKSTKPPALTMVAQAHLPATSSQPDPVDKLVAQAEKQYQQGQQEYAAGHLDGAKQSFDQAVNILLEGQIDVRSDERLQRELDKISEGVNQLEVAALQQGDGFTEQKAKPAPIDEANDITFPVDPNIKARAEAQVKETRSDLPLIMNDFVAGYINFYSTRGHGTLERALVRSGRYRDMITRVLKQEGVPQDLMYLAEAESGFEPLALSRAGARGMWQFMASRAKGYGLQRSWWIDERQDPEKATRAAAHHLRDLYNQFGDWYLAMAAYNSGPGNVQQAVRRTGYADFWELYRRNVLPKETKNYVPIILAFTVMAKNPAQYGLDKIQPALPQETDTVRIDYPVDLRLVAECVDADLKTLTELNPSLLRLTTPKDSVYDLHLPPGTKDKFQQAMAAIPVDKRVSWRYHHVAAGDTLDSIARQYHTNPTAIREVNNLQSQELRAEAKLIIPITGGQAISSRQVAFSRRPTRYRVRRGDTVLTVADEFGVPPERVRRWNGLKGDRLASGRLLVIYRPVMAADNPVINSPSRHHSSKHKSRVASSVHKSATYSASSSASTKDTTVKTKGAAASSATSERAFAGLR